MEDRCSFIELRKYVLDIFVNVLFFYIKDWKLNVLFLYNYYR